MSAEAQPRRRKDKRRKKDDSDEGPAPTKPHHPQPSSQSFTEGDSVIHVDHDHGTGGHWCAKIVFFILLGILVGLIGLIIIENRGLTDLDTPVAESRFAQVFDGWVDESPPHDDHHDEHTLELKQDDDEHDDEHDEDHGDSHDEEVEDIDSEVNSNSEDEHADDNDSEAEEEELEEQIVGDLEAEQDDVDDDDDDDDVNLNDDDDANQDDDDDNIAEDRDDDEEEEQQGDDDGDDDNDDQEQQSNEDNDDDNDSEENEANSSHEMENDDDEEEAIHGDDADFNENDESLEKNNISKEDDFENFLKDAPFEEIDSVEEDVVDNTAGEEELLAAKRAEQLAQEQEDNGSMGLRVGVGLALITVTYCVLARKWRNANESADDASDLELNRRMTLIPEPPAEGSNDGAGDGDEPAEEDEEEVEEVIAPKKAAPAAQAPPQQTSIFGKRPQQIVHKYEEDSEEEIIKPVEAKVVNVEPPQKKVEEIEVSEDEEVEEEEEEIEDEEEEYEEEEDSHEVEEPIPVKKVQEIKSEPVAKPVPPPEQNVEEYEYEEDDELGDEEEELVEEEEIEEDVSEEMDDTELMKKLEEKYGKLPDVDDEAEGQSDDEKPVVPARRRGKPAGGNSVDDDWDDWKRQLDLAQAEMDEDSEEEIIKPVEAKVVNVEPPQKKVEEIEVSEDEEVEEEEEEIEDEEEEYEEEEDSHEVEEPIPVKKVQEIKSEPVAKPVPPPEQNVEEYEYEEDDELGDEEEELVEEEEIEEDVSEEMDDTELMKKLEEKYGKLPDVDDEAEGQSDDEKPVVPARRRGKPAGGNSVDDDWDDWKRQLDLAQAEMDEGKVEDAYRHFTVLSLANPSCWRAKLGRAKTLDSLAEKKKNNNLLQNAIDAYREVLNATTDDDVYLNVADRLIDRMRFRGKHIDAVPVHKLIINKFPSVPKYRNQLAITYLMVNKIESSRSVLKSTLKLWPNDGVALVHQGFILKTVDNDLEQAVIYLQKGIDTKDKGTEEGRFYFQLGDALARLGRSDEARRVYELGADLKLFLSPMQRSLYNVDRLTGHPWWKPEQTPYKRIVKDLEANWEKIAEEARRLRSDYKSEQESLKDTGDWSQYELFVRGNEVKDHCSKCPVTCRIAKTEPAASGCRRGQIKFSAMTPGTHVFAHTGPTNCRLRAHLGLQGTKDTYIRVGHEIRSWEEGKVFIFDDSFEHEVWHNGTSLRIVLIVDLWHPELTKDERISLPAI